MWGELQGGSAPAGPSPWQAAGAPSQLPQLQGRSPSAGPLELPVAVASVTPLQPLPQLPVVLPCSVNTTSLCHPTVEDLVLLLQPQLLIVLLCIARSYKGFLTNWLYVLLPGPDCCSVYAWTMSTMLLLQPSLSRDPALQSHVLPLLLSQSCTATATVARAG